MQHEEKMKYTIITSRLSYACYLELD